MSGADTYHLNVTDARSKGAAYWQAQVNSALHVYIYVPYNWIV